LKKTKNPIPDAALQALARTLLPAILEFFEDNEGQREFAEWQAQRENSPTSGEEKRCEP
jgi:hypothetical protein